MWANGAILGGLYVAAALYVFAFLRFWLMRRLDLVTVFLAVSATFYGTGLAFLGWATLRGLNDPLWHAKLEAHEHIIWLLPPISTIFSLAVWIGALVGRIRTGFAYGNRTPLDGRHELRLTALAWVLLLASILSYFLYARSYGGFIGLLSFTHLIRSALFNYVPPNPWSWLRPMGGLSLFASYLFLGVLLAGRSHRRKRCRGIANILGLIISLAFSLYVLYTWLGRSDLMFYLSALFVGVLIYRYGLGWHMIYRATLIVPAMLLSIFVATSHIVGKTNSNEAITELLAREASLRLLPFFVQVDRGDYRWMRDVAAVPFYFLPQKVWGNILGIDTASDANTEAIMGARKGESGVTGQMPVDIITFSFMQAGVVGPVALGVVYGTLLRSLDRWALTRLPPGVREVVYAHILFRIAASSVWGGDPEIIISNNIYLLVGLVLLAVTLRTKVAVRKLPSPSLSRNVD